MLFHRPFPEMWPTELTPAAGATTGAFCYPFESNGGLAAAMIDRRGLRREQTHDHTRFRQPGPVRSTGRLTTASGR